jgi:hypothetical protein
LRSWDLAVSNAEPAWYRLKIHKFFSPELGPRFVTARRR